MLKKVGKKATQVITNSSIIIVIVIQFVLAGTFSNIASACIGNIVVIGASKTPETQLSAEMIMQLITERTGTAAKIIFYDKDVDIEKGLVADDDSDRIEILLTSNLVAQWAIDFLPEDIANENPPIFILKNETINFGQWVIPDQIWLQGNSGYFILIRKEILSDFPMLPRLLNKLIKHLDNTEFDGFVDLVKAGEKAKNVARKILEQKGLI